jgi:hypothetical protein
MRHRPSKTLKDFLTASINPRDLRERFGLPHPLSKFAANGAAREGPYAEAILQFIHDLTCETPGSARHRAAMWFIIRE